MMQWSLNTQTFNLILIYLTILSLGQLKKHWITEQSLNKELNRMRDELIMAWFWCYTSIIRQTLEDYKKLVMTVAL
jgi:hypothetical protein